MDDTEIIYPVPLTDGGVATLRLPKDLNLDDAKRISDLVFALAEDYLR